MTKPIKTGENRMNNDENDWMTPKQLFTDFGIALGTQAEWRSRRFIPYSKVRNRILYSRKKINQMFEGNSIEMETKK